MKLTDDQFIEWLRKIKEHCDSIRYPCAECNFRTNYSMNACQIKDLFDELKILPASWNMEEIERIIRL